MNFLSNLVIFAPIILNVFAQITCNEINDMNDTSEYPFLEEFLEMDCSIN